MKKIALIVLCLALAGPVFAGEKEELNAQIQALQWEMNYIQQRSVVIQQQAKEIGAKLQAIQAKEAEAAKKVEEKDKKK
jgi:hypothetical protein